MANHIDDLGAAVPIGGPAGRVVSLVPSLTEAIAATRPGALVGATDWCTHPADLEVERVRGTKNPDLAAVRELAPDLVIANQEENRELDVRRLRESGVPVWVTVTEDVDGAIASMRRLFTEALCWDIPGWLETVARLWADPPVLATRRRVAVPIWRDPWMVVGRDTFTGDLARRLGLDNAFGDSDGRYPHVAVEDVEQAGVDIVLLPDEPYEFTADDGPEAFPGIPVALVSGRALTWYGPSLLTAADDILGAVRNALP